MLFSVTEFDALVNTSLGEPNVLYSLYSLIVRASIAALLFIVTLHAVLSMSNSRIFA